MFFFKVIAIHFGRCDDILKMKNKVMQNIKLEFV